MKTIKNYETYITAPKHVNIQKKNDNLIFKGPLGITLINLALYDKNGYSQYSLLFKKETSIIFFKCCNKAFFKSMLKIITDKIHVVLNGFLVALHVRGVGYRVEIQNDEFNVEKYNCKLFPSSIEAGWLAKQALLHTIEKTPVSRFRAEVRGRETFQKNKQSGLESTSNIQTLFFKVGFSHDFKYICPSSVRVFTKQQTFICIYGIDRNQVSTIAAKIRMIKKPSVYKGKGIIFSDEKIMLKHGKRK